MGKAVQLVIALLMGISGELGATTLEAVDLYPTHQLDITAILVHPTRNETVLATTNSGLYEVQSHQCSLLVGTTSEASAANPCNKSAVVIRSQLKRLFDLDHVDFSKEPLTRYQHVELGIVLTDYERHCLLLVDLDSSTVDTLIGKCGNSGTAAKKFLTTRLLRPSALHYKKQTNNPSELKIYQPHTSSVDGYSWVFCVINASESCTFAQNSVLAGTNYEPVGAYFSDIPVIELRTNQACATRLLHHSLYTVVHLCIRSGTVFSGELYFSNDQEQLQSSDMRLVDSVVKTTTHYIAYGESHISSNFGAMSSGQGNLFVHNSFYDAIFHVVITTPHKGDNQQFKKLSNQRCHTDSVGDYRVAMIESCAYKCHGKESCFYFSYNQAENRCELYETYAPLEDSGLTSVECYGYMFY